MTDPKAISAVRRSDQVYCEQVCRWESLPFGVAYWSETFPQFPELNQLRDAWLMDVSAAEAFRLTEEFYVENRARCLSWSVAEGEQPLVAEYLQGRGWIRSSRTVLRLTEANPSQSPGGEVRVLPARAMPKAYRACIMTKYKNLPLLAHSADGLNPAWTPPSHPVPSPEDQAHLRAERLNDPDLDAYVAMVDQEPVGYFGYLEAGDIGRLTEMVALPHADAEAVRRAMSDFLLRMVRRLLPRIVVTACEVRDAAQLQFLLTIGFEACGETTTLERADFSRD